MSTKRSIMRISTLAACLTFLMGMSGIALGASEHTSNISTPSSGQSQGLATPTSTQSSDFSSPTGGRQNSDLGTPTSNQNLSTPSDTNARISNQTETVNQNRTLTRHSANRLDANDYGGGRHRLIHHRGRYREDYDVNYSGQAAEKVGYSKNCYYKHHHKYCCIRY